MGRERLERTEFDVVRAKKLELVDRADRMRAAMDPGPRVPGAIRRGKSTPDHHSHQRRLPLRRRVRRPRQRGLVPDRRTG